MRFIDRSSGAPARHWARARPRIAAGAKLRPINGVSVIAKFDGEHNAMPTPVAAQATLRRPNRAVTDEGIEGRGPFAGGDAPTT